MHQCIIDEGESTCVMLTLVWKKLGSPLLQNPTTTLHAYNGHPKKDQGILPHVHISLVGKMVLIKIEVINVWLYYNLMLGRSYMYAMRSVASNFSTL